MQCLASMQGGSGERNKWYDLLSGFPILKIKVINITVELFCSCRLTKVSNHLWMFLMVKISLFWRQYQLCLQLFWKVQIYQTRGKKLNSLKFWMIQIPKVLIKLYTPFTTYYTLNIIHMETFSTAPLPLICKMFLRKNSSMYLLL